MFTIYNQNLLKISNYGYTEFTRRILHNPGLDFVSIWCQRSCWWKGCKHKFFKEFVLLAALYLVTVVKVYGITSWATRSSFIIIILYRVILWFIVGSRDERKKVCVFFVCLNCYPTASLVLITRYECLRLVEMQAEIISIFRFPNFFNIRFYWYSIQIDFSKLGDKFKPSGRYGMANAPSIGRAGRRPQQWER